MHLVEAVGYTMIVAFAAFYYIYLRQFSDDMTIVISAASNTFEAAATLIMAITITLAINHIEK